MAFYEGIEEAREMDGVLHVYQSYETGSVIDPKVMSRLAQVAVRVLLYAESKAELVGRMERAKNAIRMLDETGEDMLTKDYNYYNICRKWMEGTALS